MKTLLIKTEEKGLGYGMDTNHTIDDYSMEGKDRTEQIKKIQLSLPAEKLQCDNETAVNDCETQ